jgi:hypothetical protein
MDSSSNIIIFRAPYSMRSLAFSRSLETRHAPFAPRIAHGPRHGTSTVADAVADGVAHTVARKPLPRCSLWAAGARPLRTPARAAALMLRKDASGLRALGLTPASLLRTAHASLPAPRSRRAPAGQGQSQRRRGAPDRPSRRCERSLRSGMCAPALRLLGQPTLPRHARGLRALARKLACVVQSSDGLGPRLSQKRHQHKQFHCKGADYSPCL